MAMVSDPDCKARQEPAGQPVQTAVRPLPKRHGAPGATPARLRVFGRGRRAVSGVETTVADAGEFARVRPGDCCARPDRIFAANVWTYAFPGRVNAAVKRRLYFFRRFFLIYTLFKP